MDQLAAMRFNIDAKAVYDVNTHGDLINTGKYADLHDTLWQAFVPEKDKINSRLDIAASALLYVQTVYDLWLEGGWRQVEWYIIDEGRGYWSGNHSTEFERLSDHHEDIDRYAEEGTAPTRHLNMHFIRQHETPSICDTAILRNLHRIRDAATLFAYWTVMRDYEFLGEHMLRRRVEKAVLSSASSCKELGRLSCLPVQVLNHVLCFMDGQ